MPTTVSTFREPEARRAVTVMGTASAPSRTTEGSAASSTSEDSVSSSVTVTATDSAATLP